MAQLIPPPPDTRMVRKIPSRFSPNYGKWHFLASERAEKKCLCGTLIIDDVEYGTLAAAKHNAICTQCWPFEIDNGKNLQMELPTAR